MTRPSLPRSVRGVIVDLDDTLYPEWQFALGGLRAVARFLEPRLALPHPRIEADLIALAGESRAAVLDRYLRRAGRHTLELLATLVHVYRTHRPSIATFPDVVPVLGQLRAAGIRLGLLTDGPSVVQNAKIDGLGLRAQVDAVVCTDDLPGSPRKPSALPYRVMAQLLEVPEPDLLCVGDDRSKDFVGARAVGMMTVRVARGLEPRLEADAAFGAELEADVVVASLTEVATLLLLETVALVRCAPG